jgi:hypothetical protein
MEKAARIIFYRGMHHRPWPFNEIETPPRTAKTTIDKRLLRSQFLKKLGGSWRVLGGSWRRFNLIAWPRIWYYSLFTVRQGYKNE